jgi:IS5 family transposase
VTVLANRMLWQEIEALLAQRWARQTKAGKKIEDLDFFGQVSEVIGGGTSNAGRPRLPTCFKNGVRCQFSSYQRHLVPHLP